MAVADSTELDALLQLLPACTRCRSVRKRCDTLLPACANCAKSGLQCTFYDSISKELLPREYLSSMIDHLRSLEATRGGSTPGSATGHHSPSTNVGSVVKVRDSYAFLGNNAPIIAAAPAQHKSMDSHVYPALPISSPVLIDNQMHQFLVNRYMVTVHEVFPVFDDQALYFLQALREDPDPIPGQVFLLKMVYSIACHCLSGNDNRLVYLSDVLYRESMLHIETIMKGHAVEAVQAILLLAIRSTFDAATGSIGQLVNFAHRLEIELSSDTVPQTTSIMQRLQSSTTDKAQFLCAVYTWQARWRAGDISASTLTSSILSQLEEHKSSPMLIAVVRQTHLLTQPGIDSARQLLSAYNDDQMVYNVFSSHWVYRAASYLVEHADGDTITDSCILATKVLERCAMKWSRSRALQGALEDLRRNKRTVSRLQ
ncbi:hypothetical protein BJY04DRAFT_232840, partial [Aspergillus karnatakaensis]|uniref:uncharacterized protein n=1 Tax=Aspergillus karnatakaensis TaxID=1810916 RepID=UPI003CCDF85C